MVPNNQSTHMLRHTMPIDVPLPGAPSMRVARPGRKTPSMLSRILSSRVFKLLRVSIPHTEAACSASARGKEGSLVLCGFKNKLCWK